MKRIVIILASILLATSAGFAREKSDNAAAVDFDQMSNYLELENYQKQDVYRITNVFTKEIDMMLATSDVEQTCRIINPELYAGLNLLKVILDEDQYRKYLSILNETVGSRSFDLPDSHDLYMAFC